MVNNTLGDKIWRLLTPELVYVGITYVVEMIAALIWGFGAMDQFISEDLMIDRDGMMTAMMTMLTQYGLLIQSLAAFIAIFFLARMYMKDYKSRRYIYDRKSVNGSLYIWLIPAGMTASLAGNLYINMTDLAALSEGYQESAEILFSGPVWLQMLGIGLIIPVCEELVYRGLIYMRMRQYMNVNLAICMSAAFFAIVHGNIVQGIYAFILGILFAYIYEKYGSLLAPMLTHISANLMSLILGSLPVTFDGKMVLFALGTVALILCGCVLYIIDRKVNAERIYLSNHDESGDFLSMNDD